MGFNAWSTVFVALIATTAAQSPFTLEEWLEGQFTQRGFTGTWISDTEFTYVVPGQPGINVFNASSLTSDVFVAGDLMASLATTNPILSADRQYILAPTDVRAVYRYSTVARYSLYQVSDQSTRQIADHELLQLCIFGGGHSLAYVLNNNLYYLPENSTQPIQLTDDGIPDVIYNGHTDWVYEEDVMYTGQATWFSTEGSYLAFAKFNDTEVETYSYYHFVDKSDPDDPYPVLIDLKYPKVNRVNPPVSLQVVNLNQLVSNNELNFITLEAPEEVTDDHILGGVTWTTDTEIAVHWLNRRQNDTILRICDIVSGECMNEPRQEPNGWVAAALPRFSRDGSFYVSLRWSLEQIDGNHWQHLFVVNRIGSTTAAESITPGAFTVNNFVGMDEDNNAFYYTRTDVNAPWRTAVYMTGANTTTCLSCDIVLPGGGPCSWATATLSLGGSFMTITCSSPNEPAAAYIYDPRKQEILQTWEENLIVRQRLLGKALPQSIITTVPLENGFPAPVRLLLPPGLNVSDPTTKYPVIFYVYPGPNFNSVVDTFTVGYHSYLTTSRNIIYMLADGRGSGLKGKEMLYSINNALGSVEIEDQFVILKQVMDRYEFIDRTRVGIWGHSYGGYATLLTLVHDDEHIFNCGVSGAPVTSWLYYNTMYTERFMGRPTEDDNLQGYKDGDVTLLAEKLRGHDFYIMHGNADDNVHYQNAAKLMRALQQLDIPFEQMSYPDEAHSLTGVNLHRYHTMDRYWSRCLNMTGSN